MVFRIIYNSFLDIFTVFGKVNLFIVYISSGIHYGNKLKRIKYSYYRRIQNIRRVFNVHYFTRGLIDLLYLKLLVQNYYTVRRIPYYFIGKRLCLFLQKRQAHSKISLILIYRNSFFTACIISAASAVELLIRRGFSHFMQNFLNNPAARHCPVQNFSLELLFKLRTVNLRCFKPFFPGIFVNSNKISHRLSVFLIHCRSPYAASGTCGHLYKAIAYFSVNYIFDSRNTVICAVNR